MAATKAACIGVFVATGDAATEAAVSFSLTVETSWTRLEGVCDTWSKEDCTKSKLNNKGINAIFMAVSHDDC